MRFVFFFEASNFALCDYDKRVGTLYFQPKRHFQRAFARTRTFQGNSRWQDRLPIATLRRRKKMKVRCGEAPQPAREARALPGKPDALAVASFPDEQKLVPPIRFTNRLL
jgi:hypothetical protein